MNPAGTATRTPWASDPATIAADLGTDLGRGLGVEQAARRLAVGPNALIEQDQPGPWRIFVRQFANTMTVVLAAAALVELAAGDLVPADLPLVDVHGMRVNEAALTGESESSAKTADTLASSEGVLVADRHDMALKGTAIVYGPARGVVVATGMATELGQIAALLQAHAVDHTPLQRRLAVLAAAWPPPRSWCAASCSAPASPEARGRGHVLDLGQPGRGRHSRRPARHRHRGVGPRRPPHGPSDTP